MATAIKATGNYGKFHATPEDDRATLVKKFFARNVLVIAAVIFMIISLIAFSAVTSNRGAQLDRQAADILSLEREVSTAKSTNDADYGQVLRIATGGVDNEHRREDDRVVEDLMETALTWDGISQYLEKRKQVMERFGFPEDSQFMRFFMPGELEGVARTAPSGETHYAFDKNISNAFDSLESHVVGVNGDVYSYIAVVGMRTKSTDGQASNLTYSILRYDVVDGRIVNIVAETAPGGIQVSG